MASISFFTGAVMASDTTRRQTRISRLHRMMLSRMEWFRLCTWAEISEYGTKV